MLVHVRTQKRLSVNLLHFELGAHEEVGFSALCQNRARIRGERLPTGSIRTTGIVQTSIWQVYRFLGAGEGVICEKSRNYSRSFGNKCGVKFGGGLFEWSIE